MNRPDTLREQWLHTRQRLIAKGLLSGEGASLSLRCPGTATMWFGRAADAAPMLLDWPLPAACHDPAAAHGLAYALRGDAGAIAWGGGMFGALLADHGATMPQVFDEQARHLGGMPTAAARDDDLRAALSTGCNALLWRSTPLCLGTTCTRLALNAELFEKCAQAYVLAAATGARIKPLPWWVRRIANRRLAKDEERAAQAFAGGGLPAESRAY